MSVLPDEIRPILENGIPVLLATCSKDGVPNASIVSQVRWVDGDTVALSFQFFNKTIRNVRENPQAQILLNDLEGGRHWRLEVRYDRSETEGPVFDAMDLEIEAIASATGMAGIFKLRAADLYRVLAVERL
jgi:predicted pyridoxine 5'-phosphate oxidase superfamily flavin-nucleotide-binding protein